MVDIIKALRASAISGIIIVGVYKWVLSGIDDFTLRAVGLFVTVFIIATIGMIFGGE